MSYLTPKDLLEKIWGELPQELVKVRGTAVYENGYTKLVEGDYKVDVVADGVDEIPPGVPVEIEGFLSYFQYREGGLFVRIRARKITPLEETQEDLIRKHFQMLEENLRSKTYRGFLGYVFKVLEEKGRLEVALIHGRSAQVHKDFEQAFISSAGVHRSAVSFSVFETTLSSDEELAGTLRECRGYDMVYVLRGGGAKEELSRVGGLQSLMVVLQYDIPLYLALGHTLDKNLSLLERVCDHSFATPSMAGMELGKVVSYFFEHKACSEEEKNLRRENTSLLQEIEKVKLEFRFQLNQKEREKAELSQSLERVQKELREKPQGVPALALAVAVLIGVLIGILLSRLS